MLSLQRLLIPSSKRLLIPSSKRLLRCPPLSLHGFCKGCSTRSNAIDMAYSSFQPDDAQKDGSDSPIIILHGLLGSKKNWRTMGKSISEETGKQVFVVDARNHGDSPYSEELSYSLFAEDTLKFMERHNIQKASLMGHCMGGRTAMLTALQEPAMVDKLLIIEVSPFTMSPSLSEFPNLLAVMKNMKIPENLNIFEARKFAENQLMTLVPGDQLREFFVSTLAYTKDGYKWMSNVEAIAKNFNPHVLTFPFPNQMRSFQGKTTFLAGGLSDFIRPTEEGLIRGIFPQATFHYMEDMGHSPQLDDPRKFLNVIVPILKG